MSKKIESLDAAKIYIVAELSRIFSAAEIQNELTRGVNSLSEKDIWRFLEALSFSHRLNPMFWLLSDNSFSWREEDVDCAKLTLTGMKPEIDTVTHSNTIQNDPIKFRDYLMDYFKKHPNDDPQGLGQFRPSGKEIRYPTIFLKEEGGRLSLLDGSNRLIATLLQGKTKINAIIGTKMGDGKPRIGDSTFWLLRHMYEQGDAKEKEAILSVVKQLIRESSDGKEAVREYWIRHTTGDDETKKIGELLLYE